MSKELPCSAFEPSTLVELLRKRAEHQGERPGFTFLVDGDDKEATLTYAELDRQARAIGALLQSCGTAGERALLLYPPGLEFIAAFFGCLYAAVVGIPAPLPRMGRPDRVLSRLRAIADDARPKVVLTTSPVLGAIKDFLMQAPELSATRWLTTDNVAAGLMDEWWAPQVSAGTLAYLQYTSGSTSSPKGVMVSHGNLLECERMIRDSFGQTERSVMVGWLPHYHDMGLVGNILLPLYVGGRSILMSPLLFLQRPHRWLRAISRFRATISGGPNFAYDLCVRKTPLSVRSRLDLGSWRVAFNGSEPVRPETLERFSAAFATCGFDPAAFHPCYGLAEATLLASGWRNGATPVIAELPKAASDRDLVAESFMERNGSRVVSCGRPPLGQDVVITDPETATRRPSGHIGEIWLSGPNVALGYWNQGDETDRIFGARLADTGEGPYLRTGDLGFVRDGELFVTGRLKDLIIIRGQNYFPQDIEWTVQESHPWIRPWCSAAFSVVVDGEERLVALAELDPRKVARDPRALDLGAIMGTIRQAISEQYGLHVHSVLLLEAGTIPKTSSGKIQRHACRVGYHAGTLSVVGIVSDEEAIYRN